MLKRAAEETVVNLLLLFVLFLLAVMLLPSHTIQLALRDMAGEFLEMRQTFTVFAAMVFHVIDSIGALVFSIAALS